jgi:hypothetical protein
MQRGEIEKLKANYRRALARDGYALVKSAKRRCSSRRLQGVEGGVARADPVHRDQPPARS